MWRLGVLFGAFVYMCGGAGDQSVRPPADAPECAHAVQWAGERRPPAAKSAAEARARARADVVAAAEGSTRRRAQRRVRECAAAALRSRALHGERLRNQPPGPWPRTGDLLELLEARSMKTMHASYLATRRACARVHEKRARATPRARG